MDNLFEHPFTKRHDVEKLLGVSNPTAGNIIDIFCKEGILMDASPDKSRNKLYEFEDYLSILEKGTEVLMDE